MPCSRDLFIHTRLRTWRVTSGIQLTFNQSSSFATAQCFCHDMYAVYLRAVTDRSPRSVKMVDHEAWIKSMWEQGNYEALVRKMWELGFPPPCECEQCLLQYRAHDMQKYAPYAYLQHHFDDEASELATTFKQSILADMEFLRHHIATSGNVILKRWRRRTPAKRKDLLKQIEPEVYPTSTPFMDLATRLAGKSMYDQQPYRVAYLIPYLNLECLSIETYSMIGLLNHRTTSGPDKWVVFDNAMIQSSWEHCAIMEKSAYGCIVMYGDQHGELKDFNLEQVHRGSAYGAPRALLILEAQQHLMKFLRKFIVTILGDSGLKENLPCGASLLNTVNTVEGAVCDCDKWTKFTDIGFPPCRTKPWASAASFYANQPFSTPPRFDVDAMIEIAENQASEAQDELCLLQTDSDYFYERAKYHEVRWHESITKLRGTRPPTHADNYGNISFIMTIKVMIRARYWHWLVEECRHVKHVLNSQSDEIDLEKPLPIRCNNALFSLQLLLLETLKYHEQNLTKNLFRSKAFSSMFELTHAAHPNAPNWGYGFGIADSKSLYRRDRTGWCLSKLVRTLMNTSPGPRIKSCNI